MSGLDKLDSWFSMVYRFGCSWLIAFGEISLLECSLSLSYFI